MPRINELYLHSDAMPYNASLAHRLGLIDALYTFAAMLFGADSDDVEVIALLLEYQDHIRNVNIGMGRARTVYARGVRALGELLSSRK